MTHLIASSSHSWWFPLLIVIGIVLITKKRGGRPAAWTGSDVPAGPSAMALPVVIALIAFTTYLAAATASGAHAARWISDMVPAVHGSGVKAVQTRPLDGFKELLVEGPIVVDFAPGGEKAQAVVDGDDNIVPMIKTNVSDGVLRVELDSGNSLLSTVLPMHVSVTGPAVDSGADLDDAGTLTLADMRARSLSLRADGAATLKASGSADDLQVNADGAGICDASKLTAGKVKIHCDGAAKAMVQVSGSLDARADAASVITVTGKADNVVLDGSGASYFHLKELLAKAVQVTLDGAANAHVNASESVTGKVEGASTLRIRGNPGTVEVKSDESSTVSRNQ